MIPMQDWVVQETRTAQFGDERLDRRYALLLDRLSDKPSLSIPATCSGYAETVAAYRFFDNERVSAQRVLQPHHEATLQRVRQETIVLIAQDTTELDLTRRQEKVGGPLNDDTRWGLFAHPLLAMTPARLPLGVIGARIWSRDAQQFAQSPAQKRRARKAKPIKDKESSRWLEGYQAACAVAQQAATTTVVALSDSEGDIYECFVEAMPQGSRRAEWIVRACQERALAKEDQDLRQRLLCTKPLGTLTIQVSPRDASTGDQRKRKQARSGRKTKVSVRAVRVTLRPPRRPDGKLPAVTVNAILVSEEKPPAGEEPIAWLLLTSLPVETFAAVQTVIDYYCCRWEIEVYFRVLKGGCRVEDLQLETSERFEACLALYLIVSWRVLSVLMLGRECPQMRCDAVLTEAEWKSVYQIVGNRKPPSRPPALGEMVEMIAELGGYLGRKHDGPPGPKVIWIGLQRTRDFALAWTIFSPGPNAPRKCVER
jgi:hypothetical protein